MNFNELSTKGKIMATAMQAAPAVIGTGVGVAQSDKDHNKVIRPALYGILGALLGQALYRGSLSSINKNLDIAQKDFIDTEKVIGVAMHENDHLPDIFKVEGGTIPTHQPFDPLELRNILSENKAINDFYIGAKSEQLNSIQQGAKDLRLVPFVNSAEKLDRPLKYYEKMEPTFRQYVDAKGFTLQSPADEGKKLSPTLKNIIEAAGMRDENKMRPTLTGIKEHVLDALMNPDSVLPNNVEEIRKAYFKRKS